MSTSPRKEVHVLAGVILDEQGRVLLAQRPLGKDLAGLWEFPGGKIEPGETRYEALARELHEELGIKIGPARPLIRLRHAYPLKTVLLDFWIVRQWTGTPQSLDGQRLQWCTAEQVESVPLLPADRPVVQLACLPDELRVTSTAQYQVRGASDAQSPGRLQGIRCTDIAAARAAVEARDPADFIVMSTILSDDQAEALCRDIAIPVFIRSGSLQAAWNLGATGISHLN